MLRDSGSTFCPKFMKMTAAKRWFGSNRRFVVMVTQIMGVAFMIALSWNFALFSLTPVHQRTIRMKKPKVAYQQRDDLSMFKQADVSKNEYDEEKSAVLRKPLGEPPPVVPIETDQVSHLKIVDSRKSAFQSLERPSGQRPNQHQRKQKPVVHMAPTTQPPPYIPLRRIVHFDLKGAPPKIDYFVHLLHLIRKLGATGILIEWEDMFPLTGNLAKAKSGNAYTMDEVERILDVARKEGLTIIPLIQTFGHLEWLLKLDAFAHLRDDPKFSTVICAAKPEAWQILQDLLRQVIDVHVKYGMPYFHIGCDEVYKVGECPEAIARMNELQYGNSAANKPMQYMLWHISRLAEFVKHHVAQAREQTRVLAWHDMLVGAPESFLKASRLYELIEPVLWNYASVLHVSNDVWAKLQPFKFVWAAGSFKGADGPRQYHSNAMRYVQNQNSWLEQMRQNHANFTEFRGIILTGWSRFDHFAVLCETLPVGTASLVMSLLTLQKGSPIQDYKNLTEPMIGCELRHGQAVVRQRQSQSAPSFRQQSLDGLGTEQNQQKNQGCNFMGFEIWQLTNQLVGSRDWVHGRTCVDRGHQHTFDGWLGETNRALSFTSAWYLQQMRASIEHQARVLREIYRKLDRELRLIFYDDTANEFLFEYVLPPLKKAHEMLDAARTAEQKREFPRRPFPEFQGRNSQLLADAQVIMDKYKDE